MPARSDRQRHDLRLMCHLTEVTSSGEGRRSGTPALPSVRALAAATETWPSRRVLAREGEREPERDPVRLPPPAAPQLPALRSAPGPSSICSRRATDSIGACLQVATSCPSSCSTALGNMNGDSDWSSLQHCSSAADTTSV